MWCSYNERELLNGVFYMHIQSVLCQVMKMTTAAPSDLGEIAFFSESILQRILRCLLWSMGSPSSDNNIAIKGLRVFCTFYRAKSWLVKLTNGRNENRQLRSRVTSEKHPFVDSSSSAHRPSADSQDSSAGNDYSSNLNENVVQVLSSNILYIIKNFQCDVKSSFDYQVQAIKVMQNVVKLLKSEDIGVHLSKVSVKMYTYISIFIHMFLRYLLLIADNATYR